MKSAKHDVEVERFLIQRSRDGCSEALADLVRMHLPQIYGMSLKILKNDADAQDNVQDVLCKMYAGIRQFEGRSRLSTWLCRITINEALMKLRRAGPEQMAFDATKSDSEEQSVLDITDRRPDPEQQYIAKDLVAKAFLGLHPSVTQLFMRHKFEGWTQRELAGAVGISPAALKSRLFWARERMQRRLEGLSYFGGKKKSPAWQPRSSVQAG